MRKVMTAMAAVFVFTACDGNPFGTVTGTTTPTTPTNPTTATAIPDAVASNLTALSFDATASTVTVEISGLDSSPSVVSTFTRNLGAEAGLPAGHLAYTLQEDPLDRFFSAIVSESNDGTVRGGVVSDGGQFLRFFSGVYYERDGGFTPPTSTTSPGSGQVSYAGDYVGLDNWSGPVPNLPAGTHPSIQMQAPGRVTGQIFLNVNFDDLLINGSVFNRILLDRPSVANPNGDPHQVPTLILTPGNIAADGTYAGDSIEASVDGTLQSIGQYSGIFGGANAASMAGGLIITDFDPNLENESEHGFWVLTQCGQTGENAALCNGTQP